ncbi:preprotein translocase subunit YajC [Lampropedia cohaerens]|uniref:Sec translocon accessory complex subunit YajC n=1 Tax=Lampropedia cohaerens TaxID=1610491 RepID=A0A0U1Q2Z7_9BURK|nr:preprotein translocase subunit YajC [Lampropedia cohaerens]KKW69119.1 preprotein translocase subunit YajC [Lampropedia cohaerens]
MISNAYAQTAPAAEAAGGASLFTGMLPLILMFVVLYFIMIRPQMKRQKEHRAMLDALAKGDEVSTAGGIVGRVSKLSEQWVHLEIANGVEVQLQRSAISQVLPKGTWDKTAA